MRLHILVILLSPIAACSNKDSNSDKVQEISRADKGQVTEVMTQNVKLKPFEYLIQANGKVESTNEASIEFLTDGTIADIRIRNGLFVAVGDTLARLENQQFKMNLKHAETAVREKQLEFEDKIMSYTSQKAETLKTIRENIRYSSGLASAELDYEQALLNFANTIIKAPISGLVSNLNFKNFNTLSKGDVLCVIHDPRRLFVSCNILESTAFDVKPGLKAIIQPLFSNQAVFQAKISAINPRVDAATGLLSVQMTLISTTNLLPGMSVVATIKIPQQNNLIIPKEAVVIRSGKNVVFTFDNGFAKWHYVTLGRENLREIEVLGGLEEAQKVIVTNNLQLAHDSPVTEIKPDR